MLCKFQCKKSFNLNYGMWAFWMCFCVNIWVFDFLDVRKDHLFCYRLVWISRRGLDSKHIYFGKVINEFKCWGISPYLHISFLFIHQNILSLLSSTALPFRMHKDSLSFLHKGKLISSSTSNHSVNYKFFLFSLILTVIPSLRYQKSYLDITDQYLQKYYLPNY